MELVVEFVVLFVEDVVVLVVPSVDEPLVEGAGG